MRLFLLRTFQLVTISVLFTASGLLFPWTDYRHASEFDKTVPLWSSDYRPTTVWGSPFPYIVDAPHEGTLNKMSRDDRFEGEVFIADAIIWLFVTTTAYLFCLAVWLIVNRGLALGGRRSPLLSSDSSS